MTTVVKPCFCNARKQMRQHRSQGPRQLLRLRPRKALQNRLQPLAHGQVQRFAARQFAQEPAAVLAFDLAVRSHLLKRAGDQFGHRRIVLAIQVLQWC